jgi:ABC-type branched-subunit amino acid transport system ATPase component
MFESTAAKRCELKFKIFAQFFYRERKNRFSLTTTDSIGCKARWTAGNRTVPDVGPKLILFDEPSLGLAPVIVDQVEDIIVNLKNKGITILLAEQNANLTLRVSDYAYVIETGEVILEGPPEKLANDQKVIGAYPGRGRRMRLKDTVNN